jgi:23S rRNA pseudouridine955/2504/2580 synthase
MNEPSQASGKPRSMEIGEEHAGQRIDNFLIAQLKGVPKSHVYRILRTGEVRVNGGRRQARHRLEAGDIVRIPPLRLPQAEAVELPENLIRTRLADRVLYEDEHFLALDKPAGMAAHGGSGLAFGVIEGLRKIRPEARFLELVHRLDRDTSGCLLIAKKRSALRGLHELFRADRAIDKVYQALLCGAWARKHCVVDAPLKKNVLQSGERMVRVARDGKPASTEFRRMRQFAAATLVEARLFTGRTHQIRVHAQSIGHPVAGDERYGDEARNLEFRRLGLKRLFLHAASLSFPHPETGQALRIEAPMPRELQAFLESLPT